jgi:uncharacterized RDD family membrane protein YckC
MGSALLDATSDLAFEGAAADSSAAAGMSHAAAKRPLQTASQIATQSASSDALRLQVAERLAAHRSRRGHAQAEHAQIPSQPPQSASTRSARIAATVAERYAHSQSYRAFLAAEAERAIQQAHAVARVAALNAQAVAAAQQRLLDAFDEDAMHAEESQIDPQHVADPEFQHVAEDEAHSLSEQEGGQERSLWPEPEVAACAAAKAELAGSSRTSGPKRGAVKTASAAVASASTQATSGATPFAGGMTVRLYEDAARAAHVGLSLPAYSAGRWGQPQERSEAEALALDEEIAFRQSPVFEEPAGPPVALPANLIEFPRQLIASRKARPRYAEGPLREEAGAAAGDSQLRIFEVDAAQISTKPAVADAAPPQWNSIWLDTPAGPAREERSVENAGAYAAEGLVECSGLDARFAHAAPIGRRVMAAAINTSIVCGALLAFAATFVVVSSHLIQSQAGVPLRIVVRGIAESLAGQIALQPSLILGLGVAAGALLCLLYQALFFSFSSATPGMRCARIALCTFDDENPTRSAMRRRAFAVLLSACPLGLGFLWATIDEDRLAWHDRISRMYQRSY